MEGVKKPNPENIIGLKNVPYLLVDQFGIERMGMFTPERWDEKNRSYWGRALHGALVCVAVEQIHRALAEYEKWRLEKKA